MGSSSESVPSMSILTTLLAASGTEGSSVPSASSRIMRTFASVELESRRMILEDTASRCLSSATDRSETRVAPNAVAVAPVRASEESSTV